LKKPALSVATREWAKERERPMLLPIAAAEASPTIGAATTQAPRTPHGEYLLGYSGWGFHGP